MAVKGKNVWEWYFNWLFEDPSMDPPQELLDAKQITHKTIFTTFLMNHKLTEYLVNRLAGYNIYAISKKDLLRRLKELVKKFKVSKWDFWTLAQKKPHEDPLAKCLWDHFEIKPQDLSYVYEILGYDKCKEMCGNAKKVKKDEDIFELMAKQIDNTSRQSLQQRLEEFKQWIINQLKDKHISPTYEGCTHCPLRTQPFVPPDYIIGDPNRNEIDLVLVGMNPYEEERKQGKPFVGRSGKELRSTLQEICPNLNIVITNACMCYIPNNGDPDIKTQECCKPLLLEQLRKLKPKIVMPLGALATNMLIPLDQGITKVAGHEFVINI